MAYTNQLGTKCNNNILLNIFWKIETSLLANNSTIHHFLQIKEDIN
jgi:hypothetical protein